MENGKLEWKKYFLLLSLWMTCFTFLTVQGIEAAGGKPSKENPKLTSLKEAERDYNRGLEYKAKACVYSMNAEDEETKGSKTYQSLMKKAISEFNKSIKEFSKATKKNPKHYQAFSELGYAYRKTGKYTASLRSYSRALSINKNYAQAIEYRGVAYLYLNRLDDLKKDYITLTRLDTTLSKQLLKEIEKWIVQIKQNSSSLSKDISKEELTEFEAWMKKEMSRKV